MYSVFVIVRELLGTGKRRDEVYEYLRYAIGDSMMSYDIELVGHEVTARSQVSSLVTETLFSSDVSGEQPSGLHTSNSVSIAVDNSLSPAHTLIQITCQDHKGLLYDIMRTFKDFNIQVCASLRWDCSIHMGLVFLKSSFMIRSHMGVLHSNEEGIVRLTCSSCNLMVGRSLTQASKMH